MPKRMMVDSACAHCGSSITPSSVIEAPFSERAQMASLGSACACAIETPKSPAHNTRTAMRPALMDGSSLRSGFPGLELARGRAARAAHHEGRGQHIVMGRGRILTALDLEEPADGPLSKLQKPHVNRGQRGCEITRDGDVVEAGHRHVLRHAHAGFAER